MAKAGQDTETASKSTWEKFKGMFSRGSAAEANSKDVPPAIPERQPIGRTQSGSTESTRSTSSDDSSVASAATKRTSNRSSQSRNDVSLADDSTKRTSNRTSISPDPAMQPDSRKLFPKIPSRDENDVPLYSNTPLDKQRMDPKWKVDAKFQPVYGKSDASQASDAAASSNRTNDPKSSAPKEISINTVSGSATAKSSFKYPQAYAQNPAEVSLSIGSGEGKQQIGNGKPVVSKSSSREMDDSSRSVEAAKQSNLSPASAEKSAAFERSLSKLTSPGFNKDGADKKIIEAESRGYDNRSRRMEARLSI